MSSKILFIISKDYNIIKDTYYIIGKVYIQTRWVQKKKIIT